MRYTLLSLLLFCQFVWCGEATPTPPALSPAVQKALASYDAKLATEKQKYLAAAMKVQVELKRTLDAEVKVMTQKGDLDGALAVKAKLAELEKQMVIDDPLFGLLPPGSYEKLATKSPDDLSGLLISTKWVHQGKFVYTFTKEATYSVMVDGIQRGGTYAIQDKTLTLNWSHDSKLVSTLRWQETTGQWINSDGTPFVKEEKK